MLQQNTPTKFAVENVASGEIHLLVSGGLEGLATWDNQTGLWTWPDTGSWERNQVNADDTWVGPISTVAGNEGILQGKTYLKGISVSVLPKGSYARKLEALKLCTRIKMEVRIGTSPVISLDLRVKSKKIQGKYVFLEVDEELLPANALTSVRVYFKYRGDEYRGYTCYVTDSQDVTISLFPYVPPVEFEEYDPILNNIIQDTVSTVAQVVEPFEYHNIFLGTVETNAEHRYDGWFANWNSSEDYEQRLNGSGALWRPGEDPVIRANAEGALGIYQMLPTVFLEKGTNMANIPDYYFTSIANTSGRWLGTKNAEYHIYLGNKREFSSKNLEICKEFIKTNVQRGNLLVYQDSPFVIDTAEQGSMTANISGSVRGTLTSGKFSGNIDQGTIEGTISGEMSGIDLLDHIVSYYSSSTPLQDYTIHTVTNSTFNSIRGEGTRFLENGGKDVWTDTKGLYSIDGEYQFAGEPINSQSVKISVDSGFGTILSWGGITGSGAVNLTAGEEEKSISFKDMQFSGAGLQLENVMSGSVFIVPSGTVYVSGTTGAVTEGMSLHAFTGQLDIVNGTVQSVSFVHADDSGVVLTNIETAEQSVADFNSFVADSITFGDGFGGQVEMLTAGGKMNISSNGFLKMSLLTEDQEEIPGTGSEATGSLRGVNVFMSATLSGNPAWELNTLRYQLDPGEFLPEGIALLSGSFGEFTLQGTRTNLRIFPYLALSGSLISQYDTLQASRLLANLEAGVEFARLALLRSGTVDASNLNPRIVTEVQMPERIYEAMEVATNYVVSGATRIENGLEVPDTDPIWTDTGSILPPNFNFYGTEGSSRERILAFITGSKGAISRLSGFMSGSLVNRIFSKPFGQYTYVYLTSSIPSYLKASLQDFSGSYTRLTGEEGNQSSGVLSGSFKRIWGRFGEGTIVPDRIFDTFFSELNLSGSSLPAMQAVSLPGISGAIYGAFDYKGHLNGGCEGNMVESLIQGTISGLVSGITNGHIEGNLVNIVGVSRGSFTGTVKAGRFTGAMKNVVVSGNNLTNNVVIAGSISGVEDFSFQGLISGTVSTVVLPGQCTYTVNGFSENLKQAEIFIPEQGKLTGNFLIYPDRVGETEIIEIKETVPAGVEQVTIYVTHSLDTQVLTAHVYSGSQGLARVTVGTPSDSVVSLTIPVHNPVSSYQMVGTVDLRRGLDWRGVLGTKTKINLSGKSIDEEIRIGGTVSGSLAFGVSGGISIPPVSVVDLNNQMVYTETSLMSGQFEVSGSTQISTNTISPFFGKISPIFVSQSVQGIFDANVEENTYMEMSGEGKLQDVNGHILLKGKVEVESGAQGNLVEGHDRPFFTLQTFSGSIFPVDTTWEAFQNIEIADMVLQPLTFTSGMALLAYSTGSFGTVKEQEYVKNSLTLPQIGDIVFTGEGGKARVVSSKIYCPELHGVLTTNDKGTVISVDYLELIQ